MRHVIGILAGIFLILGMAVVLYTPLSAWKEQQNIDNEVETFKQVLEQAPEQSSIQEVQPITPYQKLYEDMQRYNEALHINRQDGLSDAWSYEQAVFDLTDYGLPTDIIGILRIPAMSEELPVYLGATKENMAKGVAVLGQTSMPVGGMNTNCVIAGHRGYGGTPFLREIEKLQPGDFVYLTTYWGEKTYEVEETAIILPDDIEAVLIQEDRELLTLITCHPYETGTHRYVVYCVAVENGDSKEIPDDAIQDAAQGIDPGYKDGFSSQMRIELDRWLPFLAIPLFILVILILIWPRNSKEQKRNSKEKE